MINHESRGNIDTVTCFGKEREKKYKNKNMCTEVWTCGHMRQLAVNSLLMVISSKEKLDDDPTKRNKNLPLLFFFIGKQHNINGLAFALVLFFLSLSFSLLLILQ
jgi:hypothetical protein